ncbi:MAG: MMPL family transporter, partial [Wenzhouxiangellaceae bacterium]|nr:MMPL family transporter [Wenzhouxiangellaceae bacterium]
GEFENDEHSVHIIGFAKIVGDVADGAEGVVMFFGVAFLITALLLLIYSKSVWLTVLPLICSTIAVVWQLGSLSLMGFGIDPMNILTPFLVFAIGVSHGVQMISGWTAEKFFGGRSPAGLHQSGIRLEDIDVVSSLDAAKATFARLLAPGTIALLSDTIGFLTILLINIQIIQELAITASVGVAIIIFTNLVLLPVLLSYARIRNAEKFRQRQYDRAERPAMIWRAVSAFTRPGLAAGAIVVGVVLFVGAFIKSQDMQIGDSSAGVPELRQDARYNRDARLISDKFSLGTDVISIIAQTEAGACAQSYPVMDAIDTFGWGMRQVDGVQQVISLPIAAKIVTAGWNEGNLRWQVLPRNEGALTLATQGIETSSGLLNRDCSAMPVMVFTEDHKAETIQRVVDKAEELKREIVVEDLGYEPTSDPAHGHFAAGEADPNVEFRLATGNVGVMAATNDVVRAAQTPMLLYVYGAIIALCLLTFRSVRGTLCIVLPLVLVSYLAYSLMAFMGIGLKVNTLPVVALGVGIGVDYGIYIYSRLASYLKEGMPLDEAYMHTLRLTGKAVFFTAVTLAVGVGTWLFSDLKFQADMGVLLSFMFIFNMIGAMLLLPALARWLLRPREKTARAEPAVA